MSEYTQFTDQELTALLKQGDQTAYIEIFSRYNKLLYSHAYNKLREREDAKDVVHDVFFSLWANRERNTPDINLIGYLFSAVRYKIADLLSRKQVRHKYIVSLENFIAQPPSLPTTSSVKTSCATSSKKRSPPCRRACRKSASSATKRSLNNSISPKRPAKTRSKKPSKSSASNSASLSFYLCCWTGFDPQEVDSG